MGMTMKNSDGTEYTTHLVNGLICQAQLTKISPNGKWIASSYRTETPAEDRLSIVTTQTAAFYNTETETTTIVSDYGESVGVHVTDDGIGFIGIGTLGISSGAVYDLNTGTDLGSTQDWVYDNYGIIIPAGYINYVSPDGRFVLGTQGRIFGRWGKLHQLVHRSPRSKVTYLSDNRRPFPGRHQKSKATDRSRPVALYGHPCRNRQSLLFLYSTFSPDTSLFRPPIPGLRYPASDTRPPGLTRLPAKKDRKGKSSFIL